MSATLSGSPADDDSRSRGRMTAILPTPAPDGNAGAPTSAPKERRWREGKSDPIARFVAPQLGISPATAEHRMRDCFKEAAVFIRAFHKLGDHVRLCRHMAALDAALAEATPPALTRELFLEEARADAEEDVAEVALLQDMSAEHKRAYLRRLDAGIAASQKLRRALAHSLEGA